MIVWVGVLGLEFRASDLGFAVSGFGASGVGFGTLGWGTVLNAKLYCRLESSGSRPAIKRLFSSQG